MDSGDTYLVVSWNIFSVRTADEVFSDWLLLTGKRSGDDPADLAWPERAAGGRDEEGAAL